MRGSSEQRWILRGEVDRASLTMVLGGEGLHGKTRLLERNPPSYEGDDVIE